MFREFGNIAIPTWQVDRAINSSPLSDSVTRQNYRQIQTHQSQVQEQLKSQLQELQQFAQVRSSWDCQRSPSRSHLQQHEDGQI
jgi:hypothetical protein